MGNCGGGESSAGGDSSQTISVSGGAGKKRDAYKLVLLGDKAVGKSRCASFVVLSAGVVQRRATAALAPTLLVRAAMRLAVQFATLARVRAAAAMGSAKLRSSRRAGPAASAASRRPPRVHRSMLLGLTTCLSPFHAETHHAHTPLLLILALLSRAPPSCSLSLSLSLSPARVGYLCLSPLPPPPSAASYCDTRRTSSRTHMP